MLKINDMSLESVQSWFLPRDKKSHKGSFGHVLIVGGDYGMPGAVRLAAEGAARVGAGIVSVITRKEHIISVVCGRPEILCYGSSDLSPEHFARIIAKASIVVLGPGLGQSEWSKILFEKLISVPVPLLVDADGLNWLARFCDSFSNLNNWILTPHPGEAARLLNVSINEVEKDRFQSIIALQKRYGGVVVLKGSESLIATNKMSIQRCLAGNPGMASAGMGDLLSGIIAGLFAQGFNLFQAAQAGVILHATAGDRIANRKGERGMLASDLLDELSSLINGTASIRS